jgi:predicted PurR-regulated permease PerM
MAGEVVAESEDEVVLRYGNGYRVVPLEDVEWEEVLETGAEAEWSKFVQRVIERAEASAGEIVLGAPGFAWAVVGTLYGFVLILMITAFVVIDRPGIVRFMQSVPPEGTRPLYQRLMEYFDRGLAGVIRGQLLICLVNGILTWIGLELLGVRYALLLGLVAGIFSLIPIFGTILSTIPIVLIAWSTGTVFKGLLALGWILFIHFVEANFLNPKIMGTASKIHPVVVVFALLAGEHAYGIVGALLAVPAASLVQSAFKFFVLDRQTEKFDVEEGAAAATPGAPAG